MIYLNQQIPYYPYPPQKKQRKWLPLIIILSITLPLCSCGIGATIAYNTIFSCSEALPLTNVVIVIHGIHAQQDCKTLESSLFFSANGPLAIDRPVCTLSGGFLTTMEIFDSGYQTVGTTLCESLQK